VFWFRDYVPDKGCSVGIIAAVTPDGYSLPPTGI